jgi:hypothetical protein
MTVQILILFYSTSRNATLYQQTNLNYIQHEKWDEPCMLQQEASMAEEATTDSTMDTRLYRSPRKSSPEEVRGEEIWKLLAGHNPNFSEEVG